MDQLHLEKLGVPTVIIATSAFQELVKKTIKDQEVAEISFVVVEHPIAGRGLEDTQKMADAAFSDILRAATQWQPTGK